MEKINILRYYWCLIKSCVKYQLLELNEKELLRRNGQFKNKHSNQRCFILGNGPSLNLYDLSVLKNEKVFVVNEFFRFSDCNAVQADYYLMADPKFFDLNKKDLGDKELIKQMNVFADANPQVSLFVPLKAKASMQKYGWDDKFNSNYFLNGLLFKNGYNHKINFERTIPMMQAVVQYAIILAIYMGFDEIYLLGTDQTNIFGNIRAYMNTNEASEYAFEMNTEARKWKNQKLTSYSLPTTLRGYARIFELYEELGKYCMKHNVKICNCAPETLIQGIQKKDFMDLF